MAGAAFFAATGLIFFKLRALAAAFGDTILDAFVAFFCAAKAYANLFLLVGLTILVFISYGAGYGFTGAAWATWTAGAAGAAGAAGSGASASAAGAGYSSTAYS